MIKKKYELIIYDWDGTLCDSSRPIFDAMTLAINDCGLPKKDKSEIVYLVGLSIENVIQRLYPENDLQAQERLLARYRVHVTPLLSLSFLYPSVKSSLQWLKQLGFHNAIATSKYTSGLQGALKTTGLAPVIDAYRTAEQTAQKPDAMMLNELMTLFNVSPAETLMIGDTTYDMQMAHNAKVDAVAVTYGMHSVKELRIHAPKLLIDDMQELVNWLM